MLNRGSPRARTTKDQQAFLYGVFLYGGVIYHLEGGLLGLRPVASPPDRYDEDRVGLDHLCFTVASRGHLEESVRILDELQVPHGEIEDLGSSCILEFRDPDNIALELQAPAQEQPVGGELRRGTGSPPRGDGEPETVGNGTTSTARARVRAPSANNTRMGMCTPAV